MLPLTKLPRYIVKQTNNHVLRLKINQSNNLGFHIQNFDKPRLIKFVCFYYQNRVISYSKSIKYQFYSQYIENMEFYQRDLLDRTYTMIFKKNYSYIEFFQYTKEYDYIYSVYNNSIFKKCLILTKDNRMTRTYNYIKNKYEIQQIQFCILNKKANNEIIIRYSQEKIISITIINMDLYKRTRYVSTKEV